MDETASTTSLLRVINERAVFERIRQLGPVSPPAPNLAGWGHPGVLEALGDQLGPKFVVENDVKLATLGEQAHGQGKGISNFAFVSIGTGIGMGIVIDGRLYRGSRGAAGEIGYLPVGEPEAKAEHGMQRRGWLESVAAADGVVATARRLGLKKVTAKEVFEAARQGDYRALEVVSIEEIGRASCRERVEISVVAVSLKKKQSETEHGGHTKARSETSE